MENLVISPFLLFVSLLMLHNALGLHVWTRIVSFVAEISSPCPLLPTIFWWISSILSSLTRWIVGEADLIIYSVLRELLGPDHPTVAALPSAPSTDGMLYSIAKAYDSLVWTSVLLVLVIPLRAFFLISEIASRARKIGGLMRSYISVLHNTVADPHRVEIPEEQLISTFDLQEIRVIIQDISSVGQYIEISQHGQETEIELPAVVTDQHISTELVEEASAPDADQPNGQETLSSSSSLVCPTHKSTKRASPRRVAKPEPNPNSGEPAYWGKPGGFRYVQLPAKKKRNSKAKSGA